MTVFRDPYNIFDVFDVYTQPEVDLFPLLRIESPRKKPQKRVKCDVNESQTEKSKVNETEDKKDMIEEPKSNKFPLTTKKTKVLHSFPSANDSSSFASFMKSSAQFMAVDIVESDFKYHFRVDLPGLTRDQISLDLDDNNLFTISATRHREGAQNKSSNESMKNNMEEDQESLKIQDEKENHEGTDANNEGKPIKVSHVLQERAYGKMERVFHLRKEVDADNISASLENGVLSVTIPQRKKAPAKKININ